MKMKELLLYAIIWINPKVYIEYKNPETERYILYDSTTYDSIIYICNVRW